MAICCDADFLVLPWDSKALSGRRRRSRGRRLPSRRSQQRDRDDRRGHDTRCRERAARVHPPHRLIESREQRGTALLHGREGPGNQHRAVSAPASWFSTPCPTNPLLTSVADWKSRLIVVVHAHTAAGRLPDGGSGGKLLYRPRRLWILHRRACLAWMRERGWWQWT